MKPLPGYADRIAEKNKMIRAGLSGEGAAPNDVTYHDDRLKPKTMVLGLDVEGASKAFPPRGPATGARRERPARWQAGADRAPAELRHDDGVRRALRRKDTHLKGSTLEALVLEPEYWFAWSEFHRKTAVYAPPRP